MLKVYFCSLSFDFSFSAKKENKRKLWFGATDDEVLLDGALVPLVTEAERDDNEADVEHEHHDAHDLRHLPIERDDSLKNIH